MVEWFSNEWMQESTNKRMNGRMEKLIMEQQMNWWINGRSHNTCTCKCTYMYTYMHIMMAQCTCGMVYSILVSPTTVAMRAYAKWL